MNALHVPAALLGALACLAAVAEATAAQERQRVATDDQAWHVDWRERDLEARWALWRRLPLPDPDRHAPFLDQLEQMREFEFLEQLVLYGEAPRLAADRLIKAGAPQWARCALWLLGSQDSHTLDASAAALRDRGALTLAWLERDPEAGGEDAQDLVAELRGKVTLQESASAAGAAASLLPPLDPAEVFAALGATEPLAMLAASARHGEPGARYEQAVERALSGYAARKVHAEPWRSHVRRLTRVGSTALRRAAYLVFTRFQPDEVPWLELGADVEDATLPAELREAALLASSYGPPARAWLELHCLILQPAHPAWQAAASRLGDLGDAYSQKLLSPELRASLAPERAAVLEASRRRIEEREGARTAALLAREIQPMLERAALADLTCNALEGSLVEWTLEFLGKWAAAPEVRTELARIRDAYEATFDIGEQHFGSLRARVRDYARTLIETSSRTAPARGPADKR